jgi:hydrophobic/amphiphilic exporter-1 (mainly G- bacteria), HAE1 family
MNITRLSIERPVGICMVVAFFVVLGLYSFYRIGVELLPAINTPYVTITVKYPGANAESVEQQVIKPIEDAVSSVSNVKKVTSTASYEKAQITLEMEFYANADAAAIDATKKVNSVRGKLPDAIDDPVVIKRDMNAKPIVEIAMTSPYPLSTSYSKAENVFQDVLQQSSGVSEIEIYGGRDKEVAIEIDKDKMAAYHLTLDKIVSALNSENQLLPSGPVYTEKTKTDVRVIAQYKTVKDIAQIQVANSSNVNIPLTAVASIKEQDARVDRFGRINGEDSISFAVYKNSEANVVSTADAVLKSVQKLRKDNPDYKFLVVSNDADYVNTSLHNTLSTLLEGLVTTGLVLFLFLRGWRSTLAVMLAIPTSLISTFFVMYMAGFTFNMMSLMGMTLCVGILVDDSIVVLENINRHLHMGKPSFEAAEAGRMEIGMAAVAITLCDIAVFLPIAFMNGMTGQFFRQFGMTIVFATLFSLFVSFTLTPMLASRFFRKGPEAPKGKIWNFMDWLENSAVHQYEIILRWSLLHRKKILLMALAAFILSLSFIPLRLVGSEYMPQTDESSFEVMVDLPIGQSVEETNKVMGILENRLHEISEVKYYLTSAGGQNSNQGRIKVQLYDRKERSRSVWQVADEIRSFSADEIKNADVRVQESQSSVAGVSSGGMRGGGGSLQIELRGNNWPQLIAAAERVQKSLGTDVKGVTDVNSSFTEGMPELQLTVDRERMKTFGTSLAAVQTAFSSAISGRSAGVIANDVNNDGQDTDIKVRFKNSDGFKASDVAAIPLESSGQTIFLGDLAAIKNGVGPVSIRRVDKQRAITIGGGLSGRPLNDVIQDTTKVLQKMDLASSGVTYRFSGQATQMDDTFTELLAALLLALVLIYMLLAVLYESTVTPFIRMFSLPLGIIGSILLLFLTHNTINLYSLIGILVMDGLVAKNGTLLLDYTLTLMHEQGMNPKAAIIEAGKVRLKPIFMTTLTMMVGMTPMALAMTEGSETRVSMAWVIIGGLLTSTVFTLIVIPIIFLFFESHSLTQWWKKIKNMRLKKQA